MSGILKALVLCFLWQQVTAQTPAKLTTLNSEATKAASDATASLAKDTAAESADGEEKDDEKVDDEADDEEDVDILKEDLTSLLSDHDTDKDGKLSMKEIIDDRADDAEEMTAAFKTADVNADTFLDASELPKLLASLQKGEKPVSLLQVEEQDEAAEEEGEEEAEEEGEEEAEEEGEEEAEEEGEEAEEGEGEEASEEEGEEAEEALRHPQDCQLQRLRRPGCRASSLRPAHP